MADEIESKSNMNEEDILLAWQTPEFVPMERTKKWYLITSIIVIALIAYAILSDSATMAVVFVLLAGMYFMVHKKEPRIVNVIITELGIFYDKQFYHYNTINAFWIVYNPPFVRALYLRLGGKAFKYVRIELNSQDPIKLRHFLSKELPEMEGVEERFVDILVRLLRLQ